MRQDIHHALRMMRRSPVFTAAAVTILALAIGANTAVFSLLHALVLRPLPVERPDQLVWLRDPSFSYPTFEELRKRADFFAGVFVWTSARFNVDYGQSPENVPALLASGAFHPTLGVRAHLGRALTPADDRPDAPPVAVISYLAWQRRFQSDAGVIGRTIRIERQPVTIAGVMPPDFFGVAPGLAPEVTIPVSLLPALRSEEADILKRPNQAWLHIMGRLKPEISRAQADVQLQVIWPGVMESTTDPKLPADRRARFLTRATSLMPGETGFSSVRNQFSNSLWILFGFVALLLLAACATVANLLLARTATRRYEMAVRLAIGAGRWRIIRQLMTEALVFSVLATLASVLVAVWAADILLGIISTSQVAVILSLRPDWPIIAFGAACCFLTAILFAVIPGIRISQMDPSRNLNRSTRSASNSHHDGLAGRCLVAGQIALSCVLLIGAALFLRSVSGLLSTNRGFTTSNVAIVAVDALAAGYQGQRALNYYGSVLDRLGAVPGVESASLSWVPPISNEMGSWTQTIAVDDRPGQSIATPVYFNAVSPGYFKTIGIELLAGRDFSRADRDGAEKTAIVNETLSRTFFAGADPVGRLISMGRHESRQHLRIVAVVKDAKYQRLQEPSRSIAYLPYTQLAEFLDGSNLVAEVRTREPVASLLPAIRRELQNIDKDVPVRTETLQGRIEESLVIERAMAVVSAFLGSLALLLAAAGVYAVMAYSVARRTGEIAIRLALGAPRQAVLWMILRASLMLSAFGVAAGSAAALGLARFIRNLLHGIAPTDAAALTAAALVVLLASCIAGYLPAYKASRVDPALALRSE